MADINTSEQIASGVIHDASTVTFWNRLVNWSQSRGRTVRAYFTRRYNRSILMTCEGADALSQDQVDALLDNACFVDDVEDGDVREYFAARISD